MLIAHFAPVPAQRVEGVPISVIQTCGRQTTLFQQTLYSIARRANSTVLVFSSFDPVANDPKVRCAVSTDMGQPVLYQQQLNVRPNSIGWYLFA